MWTWCTFSTKNTLHFTINAISKRNQCKTWLCFPSNSNINASVILLSTNIHGSSVLLWLRVKVVTRRMYDEPNVKKLSFSFAWLWLCAIVQLPFRTLAKSFPPRFIGLQSIEWTLCAYFCAKLTKIKKNPHLPDQIEQILLFFCDDIWWFGGYFAQQFR